MSLRWARQEEAPFPLSRRAPQYVVGGTAYSRQDLVHRYVHLVRYAAGRISLTLPPNIELNDLINDGVVGLIDAIEKYDDGLGVKFESYAIMRISGAIRDAQRSLDWVPRAVRRSAREIERAGQELELELGRAPHEKELAERLHLTLNELRRIMRRVRCASLVSLEEPQPNEDGHVTSLMETLHDDGNEVSAEFERIELRNTLAAAVNALPPRERTVVRLYYFDGQTLREITRFLGVSESRVSQIHAQAVARLRSELSQLRRDLGYRASARNAKRLPKAARA